ncbi:restriction endonuclease subunit S [Marinobacter sp. TBZ242]|uniref:Restriction endonuclease subunit S n=1 Tax=Marinobacter azerbaijanicus TaxID=3050455 RepID=A0ABT7IBL4_9GAMM|nr:restriction endonuclease subunit S [Marinobacter sp. TBZ242]MDL0431556.1 restriction endonuclease subunit S [Marinobacter sp. TBZ242]
MSAQELITKHLDLWTGAVTKRSSSGRGSNGKVELTGVEKLRELILELALRGKLTEQHAGDEPAEQLIERIATQKANTGNGKRGTPQPPKNETPIPQPFQVPSTWAWVPLRETGLTSTGKTPSTKNASFFSGDIPFIGPGQVTVRGKITKPEKSLSEEGAAHTEEALPGDILTVCIGGSIGKTAKVSERCGFNQQLNKIRPILVESDYLFFAISAKFFQKAIRENATGSATPIINRSKWESICIPLAPFAEQKRIVQKVDELMALCDRLEQQTSDQLEAHETLVDTLLGTLTQSENATELADNWTRLAAHFDTLFSTKQSIDKLKQTILQLAAMGRLVEKGSGDEPAIDLLTEIHARKTALAGEKRIKQPRALTQLDNTQHSYTAPAHWAWAYFQDIADEISTGPFGSMIHKHDYVVGGIPLINPSHMVKGHIKEDSSVSVTPTKAEELSSYQLAKGDIVMARRGEVGRCAVVTDRETGWLCGTGSFVLRFHPAINRQFILLLFSTDTVRDYLTGNSVGTTMTNLNHGILKKMPVALPSAEEQDRIVQKVDELMALCDQLKERLNQAGETRCQLAEAVVEKALT